MATTPPFQPWESLRIIRERTGLTIRGLAATTQPPMSFGHLSDLEAGRRWPTPIVTTKLATALHVPYTAIARAQEPDREGIAS